MDSYKRFEEFLDKMRGLLDNAEKQGHIIIRVEDLRNAFPELGESEDERVRKGLIKAVSATLKGNKLFFTDVTREEALAWLEKQGAEMKTIGESLGFTTQKECDEYNKLVSELIMSDGNKGELKKIEDEEYNGEDYGIDSLYHAQRILEKTLGSVDGYETDDGILSHKCAITAVKKLYEQKPADWSEEDEKARRALIEMVHDTIPAEFEKCNTTKVDCLVWLRKQGKQKSVGEEIVEALRTEYEKGKADAFSLMQKEWSEEDVYNSKLILSTISQDQDLSLETKNKLSSWLKSLKERYFWKPSDEQITVLELASKYERVFTPKQIDILIGLKEQLKKLREEKL